MPYGGRGRVQRHHADGDRMNNVRANIRFLCVKHHKDAHRLLDGRVGGGRRIRVAGLLHDRAEQRAATAFAMCSAGRSLGEIARTFGVCDESVRRWYRKYPEAAA